MKKYFLLLLILISLPLVILALSKSQELRSKAASDQVKLYGTPEVANITQTQALIKYVTTKEMATQIFYDTSNQNVSRWKFEDGNLKTIHTALLTGLTAGTTYYFLIPELSAVMSFKTLESNKNCGLSDFNKDGRVDLMDAAAVQRCLNTVVTGECGDKDLNLDGKIDMTDMTLITDCF